MNRIWSWFAFGVFFTLSVTMIVFGILFIRDVYVFRGEVSFGSLIFGIILLMVGGGLLSSTIAETIRKFYVK
ncbi:MAG: hypothetical protein NTU90_04795 [Proteobacteria bacterium]|jgi:hypothetical protein|nr:hypothetical protein [Pseudomonadota bacterium]